MTMGYELLIRLALRVAPYLGLLAAVGFIYHQGQLAERSAEKLRTAQHNISVLTDQRDRSERATAAAQIAAQSRVQETTELAERIRDYETALAEDATARPAGNTPAGCAVGDDGVKRLLKLR